MEAIAKAEALLADYPDHISLVELLLVLYSSAKIVDKAERLLLKTLEYRPNDPMLHISMGDVLRDRNDDATALKHYQTAVRLDPSRADVYFACAEILTRQDQKEDAVFCLNQAIRLKPDLAAAYQLLASIHQKKGMTIMVNLFLRARDYHSPATAPLYPANRIMDTFFLDGHKALSVAREKNSFKVFRVFTNPQICYHMDFTITNTDLAPLIYVPEERVRQFFATTRSRLPQTVDFDPGNPEEFGRAREVAIQIVMSMVDRQNAYRQLLPRIHAQPPVFVDGQPLRVYLLSSRLTTVMQHASANVAKAFKRLGCEVLFEIEKNDLESLEGYAYARGLYSFNPHIVFNVNYAKHELGYHPDVFNIVWYQDPLSNPKNDSGTLPWRERDIVLSAYPEFDEMIYATGARKIYRQDMCVDLDCFQNKVPRKDRRKVVFIGSSHHHSIENSPEVNMIVDKLRSMFEQGSVISDSLIRELSEETKLDYIQIKEYVYPYVVRNRSVEWLCELAPEMEWDVEIYGRFWEEVPIVAPYYRGELSYGPELAAMYNQARYALSAHPHQIKTQRLAELSACGCIPILNDDRVNVEPPHWDDEILYFRTRDDLRRCLQQEPRNDPSVIAQSFSYDMLAQRVLDWVTEKTGVR
ncbi:MAG: tetratricopeptide repeat protein [Magnetococcales bacterium]|nr:tetratricopeptide repeat protein [Magnetococcales bacterium]MBF0322669.1 tetratricopeptide repeat protein [Magnetococcales bacterium]